MDSTANAPQVDRPDIVRPVTPESVVDAITSPEEIVKEVTGIDPPPIIDNILLAKNCVECGLIFAGKNGFKELVKHLKPDEKTREKMSKKLHQAKKSVGMGGADNVEMCSETGDIINPSTKEVIGNLFE